MIVLSATAVQPFGSMKYRLVLHLLLVVLHRLLRAELHSLRRRGALMVDAASLDRPTIYAQHRTCARCLCELGRVINRGAPCRGCRLRVCKACREFTNRTTDWVCLVCHKQM